jgi:amino acid transporter
MKKETPTMKDDRPGLKRVLGRVEMFALAFGTMVGWGWIMLAGQWVALAGTLGAILVFLLAAALCILVGLLYAELTSAFPLAGGELAFSYRGMGYIGSWITGWTISLAYINVAAWEGIALSTAVDYLFPIARRGYLWTVSGFDIYFSWSAVGMVGAVLLTGLNIMGMKPVAVFQMFSILLLIVAGLICVLGGFAFGRFEYAAPAFTDLTGMGTVLLMTPSMYIGFDMIAKSAEEMNFPLKNISKVLIFSIIAAGAWYILIILATAMSAPPAEIGAGRVPVADFSARAYRSDIFAKLMICGGVCGVITSWNGFIVGASRILFAMGRSKMLPSIFGILHPRYRTPVFSIAFVGFVCCVTPLMGRNFLIRFVDVAAFGAILSYLLISVSYMMIRKNEPDLRRHCTVKRGRAVGATAIAAMLFFLVGYSPLSPIALVWPSEWLIIFGWTALGAGLFLAKRLREPPTPSFREDCERLLFGDFARERPL